MATSGDQIASEIREISAADELGQSFLPYSLSVITARALPDVRDGLKPVQRRIIVAMDGLGLRPGSPYRKSARVVGETMGNYHPHGDSAIYEALVRMGQDFSMSIPLIDPHGNFGSPDDPPAASRYTECRLTQMAMELLGEIDEETVEFRPTYDGEGEEPEYLPARFPNLLVNGSSGIAVGMATNMAPHNLVEVANLIEFVMTKRRPKPTVEEMMEVLPGPDFPTGAVVVDDGGIREAYETGRGSIKMRATVEIAQVSSRRTGIIVTELPYNVGPERVMARIKDLILANKLSGIADIKNLSDRKHGLRLQIECKTGVNPRAVLADLYRLTPMEETFGINNVALVDGQPTTLPLHALCQHWIDHRLDVIVKRTEFRMRKALDRAHILEGLLVALDNIDRVIAIIRGSKDVGEARASLMSEFNLSEIQANHILDMQLRRLTQLARIDIEEELAKLRTEIADYEKLLGSEQRRRTLVIKELRAIASEHGGPRRTKIIGEDEKPVFVPDEGDDLDIGDEPCVITLSTSGLVGREAAESTRTGKLSRHDLLAADVVTSTSATVWAVTDKGRALTVRAAEVPEVAGRSRGAASQEMFALTRAESILGLFGDSGDPLVLVTANGVTKRLTRDELAGAKTGSNVISFKGDDRLVAAFAAPDAADVVIVSEDAQALRTAASGIPTQGRNASGVAGMKLKGATKVVGAGTVGPDGVLLTATDGMSAKLTPMAEIPTKGRATGGVRVTRFRGFETQLWFAFAAPDRNLLVFVGQSDNPTKAEAEPITLEIEVSRRDAASSVIDRRILHAGKARW